MAKIDLTNGAAPSTPTAGKVSLYTKTDKKIYIKDDAGVETPLIDAGVASITALTGDVTATGPGSVAATIAAGAVTNAKVASGIDAVKIGAGSVNNTEFGYLDGVTSQLQVQLDNIVSSVLNRVPYVGAAADINLGNTQRIINLVDPALPQDAATKNYVDTGLGSIYVPYTGAVSDLVLGTHNIRMASGALKDAANLDSVLINNRALQDATGVNVVQWGTYQLFDSLTILSQNWNSRSLYRADGVEAFNWTNGPYIRLDPTPNASTLYFEGGITPYFEYNPATDKMSTGNYNIFRFNSPNVSFDTVIDSFDFKVMDANTTNRMLYDFGGILPSVDFGNYFLMNIGVTNMGPMLDWSLATGGGSVKIYGDVAGSGYGLIADFAYGELYLPSSPGTLTLSWSARQLYDNFNVESLDWDFHTLSFLGTTTANWETCVLNDLSTGTQALYWSTRLLIDELGMISISWNDRQCIDSGNVLSLDFGFRTLNNGSGTVIANFFNSALILNGTASTNNGAIWTDSTQKAFQVYQDGVKQTVQAALFTQTATGTSANSTAENTISSTGVGTLTLPTNFFVAGKTLRITGSGFHSSTASPTLNFKVKFGSTVICTTGAHTHHNATNGSWSFNAVITCRTTGAGGTVFAQGNFLDATDVVNMVNTATTSVNTTTTQAITVTAQWSSASPSNTISLTNMMVEVLN